MHYLPRGLLLSNVSPNAPVPSKHLLYCWRYCMFSLSGRLFLCLSRTKSSAVFGRHLLYRKSKQLRFVSTRLLLPVNSLSHCNSLSIRYLFCHHKMSVVIIILMHKFRHLCNRRGVVLHGVCSRSLLSVYHKLCVLRLSGGNLFVWQTGELHIMSRRIFL